MRATPDSTLANPERRIADLERQLAECRAERDEALARETATAEVLRLRFGWSYQRAAAQQYRDSSQRCACHKAHLHADRGSRGNGARGIRDAHHMARLSAPCGSGIGGQRNVRLIPQLPILIVRQSCELRIVASNQIQHVARR